MNFWILTYTLALSSLCVSFMRFDFNLYQKLVSFALIAIFINLPFISDLSIVQWLDSVLGQPSLFLFFLALSACFVIFFAPKETILPLRSKVFIAIFGATVFLGNLNLLWGFDLFSLDFKSQLVVIFGILFFAFAIDIYLGILYLLCLIIYALGLKDNIFLYLIDVSVWLYALVGIILDCFEKRKRY